MCSVYMEPDTVQKQVQGFLNFEKTVQTVKKIAKNYSKTKIWVALIILLFA
jgi:hypothetical protein